MNLIDRINSTLQISNDSKLAERLSEISGKKVDKSRISNWRNKGFFGSTKALILLLLEGLEKLQLNVSKPPLPKDGQLVRDVDADTLLRYCSKTGKWDSVCEIFGVEIQFERFIHPEDLSAKCYHIWKYPSHYSDYKDGSEDAYYKFLKFLWVRFPGGEEKRLTDVANEFKNEQ